MALTLASAQQQYVFNASAGAVTEPVYGSWLAAYATYLGATEPKGTWLQTICDELGVTEPVNGSWVQALANYYGVTDTIGYGNWWLALADATFATVPQVDFTANFTTISEGNLVDFTDLSNVPSGGSPITAWLWTLEGAVPATSTLQNPTNVLYEIPGNYSVTLEATNAEGTGIKSVPGYITVTNDSIIAEFSADNLTPFEGGTVNFADESYGDTPTAWEWTFPGATPSSSTDQNPTVVYNTPGVYDVTLKVYDESGSDTLTKVGYIDCQIVPVVANFTVSDTTPNVGDTVTFTDLSTGDPTAWDWEFSGGTPDVSAAQNPSVTYDTAGTYSVVLTASKPGSSDVENKVDYITVSEEQPYVINSWNLTTGYNILESSEIDTEKNLMLFRL